PTSAARAAASPPGPPKDPGGFARKTPQASPGRQSGVGAGHVSAHNCGTHDARSASPFSPHQRRRNAEGPRSASALIRSANVQSLFEARRFRGLARRSVKTTDFTDGHGSSPANSRESYRLY